MSPRSVRPPGAPCSAARRPGGLALALAALVAGCGVKAPPRPPLPAAAQEPAAAAPAGDDCGCAPPSPFFATTTTTGASP
jgi:hypothetical protein